MLASPTPSEAGRGATGAAWASLTGKTPLVRLRHSGEGRVLLKLEGRQASGTYWDRVVAAQFAALPEGACVAAEGLHAHTVAVAAFSRATGRPAVLVDTTSSEPRLASLVGSYGLPVVEVVPAGAVLLRRDDAAAHGRAFAAWFAELPEALLAGNLQLVLPAFSGLTAAAAEVARGHTVVWVADDGERRRTLGEDAACRRTQVAHREGLLLSPLGAELVDAGVAAAVSSDATVLVLVPEGGQRHLGWW